MKNIYSILKINVQFYITHRGLIVCLGYFCLILGCKWSEVLNISYTKEKLQYETISEKMLNE